LIPGLKKPGREADHALQSSINVLIKILNKGNFTFVV
jgi:hypothetical protein